MKSFYCKIIRKYTKVVFSDGDRIFVVQKVSDEEKINEDIYFEAKEVVFITPTEFCFLLHKKTSQEVERLERFYKRTPIE